MKKPISMMIAILTISCAACFAGCAKSPDKKSGTSNGNIQRITPKDDNTDSEKPSDRECPDGNCGRRGPHSERNRARRIPIGENFTFIIEINPDCRHGKCRPQDKPENGETAPAPDDSENGTTTD